MGIEADLYTHLRDHTGLSALISGRVYPLTMPQDVTLPAVVYQRVTGPREYSFTGSSGLAHPRFQVSVWAETYASAKDVAEQIKVALGGYNGGMGSGGTLVYGSFIENELDFYEPDTRLYHVPVDFTMWHRE